MAKYLALGATKWDFKDRETGREVKGARLYYVIGRKASDGYENANGYEQASISHASLPGDLYEHLPKLPALVEAELEERVRRDGTRYMVALSVGPVNAVGLSSNGAAPVAAGARS